jgi:hypothetical protein
MQQANGQRIYQMLTEAINELAEGNGIHEDAATFLFNAYRVPTQLRMGDGDYIWSSEGTTQGDALATTIFGLAIWPLIQKALAMLNKLNSGGSTDPRQIWYADDSTCGGKLSHLQEWMSFISKEGEGYGYVLNPKKCITVVLSSRIAEARKFFPHIPAENIRTAAKYLGGYIGEKSAIEALLATKIDSLCEQLAFYTSMAREYPRSALSLVQYSLLQKVNFLQRVCPAADEGLQIFETQMRDCFLPAITGTPYLTEVFRSLLLLPTRSAVYTCFVYGGKLGTTAAWSVATRPQSPWSYPELDLQQIDL